MSIQQSIETKLQADLQPALLVIDNESHLHGGSATESHFKLTVVAGDFKGLSRVQRHQRIYRLLADEMAGELHALALHLYSPDEWAQRRGDVPVSPDCRGGSKADPAS